MRHDGGQFQGSGGAVAFTGIADGNIDLASWQRCLIQPLPKNPFQLVGLEFATVERIGQLVDVLLHDDDIARQRLIQTGDGMGIDVLFQLSQGRKRCRVQVEKILQHITGIDILHHVGGDFVLHDFVVVILRPDGGQIFLDARFDHAHQLIFVILLFRRRGFELAGTDRLRLQLAEQISLTL